MNLLWGGIFSAYKIIGPDLPAGGIVTLRFGFAAAALVLAWPWLPGPTPRGRDLFTTCLMGLLLYVVGQRLQVYGNQLGTAGNSSVLIALEPVVTSLAAALFLKEHIGWHQLAGFALGMVGVALLNGVWRTDFQWTGLAASFIFVSSFACEAAYSILGKPIIMRASAMKMLAISLLVGTAANLVIDGHGTVTAARALRLEQWMLLAGMGVICSAVGYAVWFMVIRDTPISIAALTIFAQSVFGVALAALWIGEKLRWEQLMGSVAIGGGIVIGLWHQIRAGKGRSKRQDPRSREDPSTKSG